MAAGCIQIGSGRVQTNINWKGPNMKLRPKPHSVFAVTCIALMSVISTRADDIIKSVTIGGHTYLNVRAKDANPVDVLLVNDGKLWNRVKRQDLPAELKGKYPYDAEAAEEYERQKTVKAKAQRDRQRQEV